MKLYIESKDLPTTGVVWIDGDNHEFEYDPEMDIYDFYTANEGYFDALVIAEYPELHIEQPEHDQRDSRFGMNQETVAEHMVISYNEWLKDNYL